MRIRAGYEIAFNCLAPTPIMLTLSVHTSRQGDLESPDWIRSDPIIPISKYIDGLGNVCSRIVAPVGRTTLSADFVIRDSGRFDDYAPDAPQVPVEDLPDDVLIYLLGSRYCETDRLSDIAWSLFENSPPGWGRVQAICDYAHQHIGFDYQRARPTRSAFEAYQEGVGVCRDFAHLALTLCRCMNIPARYCTGYLPDIGVPVTGPMDFAAWFEVWLGGRWYVFDARNNIPRVGRILLARGRDATDVAISNQFGAADLAAFTVIADELPDEDGRLATLLDPVRH